MKRFIKIGLFLSFVLSLYFAYNIYFNRCFIPSVGDSVLVAKRIKVEMEQRNIEGSFNKGSVPLLKKEHPKIANLLEELFTCKYVSFFELRNGTCIYSTIWCKDPLCEYPSGDLTRHVVSNVEPDSRGVLIGRKKVKNWYYFVYQEVYP